MEKITIINILKFKYYIAMNFTWAELWCNRMHVGKPYFELCSLSQKKNKNAKI